MAHLSDASQEGLSLWLKFQVINVNIGTYNHFVLFHFIYCLLFNPSLLVPQVSILFICTVDFRKVATTFANAMSSHD